MPDFEIPVISPSGGKPEPMKKSMTLYIIIGVSIAVALLGCIGIIYACVARKKYANLLRTFCFFMRMHFPFREELFENYVVIKNH